MTEEEELLIATKLFVEELKGQSSVGRTRGQQIPYTLFGRVSNENYQRLTESSEESPILVKLT